MAIDRNSPQVASLVQKIESIVGFRPSTHEDFVKLNRLIFQKNKEYVSETTLERVWGYSTRGYNHISLRTLNVLCRLTGNADWSVFCRRLHDDSLSESEMFDSESISAASLNVGDRIVIGWQPDRVCTVRYLGDNRFVAEQASNAKLHEGDTFSCLQFQLGTPLILENLAHADGQVYAKRYGAGLKNGLTMLRLKK